MKPETKSRLISSARLVGDTGIGYLALDAFSKGNYITAVILGTVAAKFAIGDMFELSNGTASLSYLQGRRTTNYLTSDK
ncbi:MAG: hypothetical protein AABX14_02645 [Candidatus Aenigmatarchaeota archaeon]|mgnify:CR=1 FL=1